MPDLMPHDLIQIPLSQIDAQALTRDRSVIITQELEVLTASISTSGLRQPIEVFQQGDGRYALISGYRRLMAFQQLLLDTGETRWAEIAAFVRPPVSGLAALAAVVEENEIRSQLSSWEKGRIIHVAVEQNLAATIEESQNALFPTAGRMTRFRLRSIAKAVEVLGDMMQAAEDWSERQCLRVAAAVDAGFAPCIIAALENVGEVSGKAEWQAIEPYIVEAETLPVEEKPIKKRPRRLSRPQPGLTMRREKIKAGFAVIITGDRASDELMDRVFENIERWLATE